MPTPQECISAIMLEAKRIESPRTNLATRQRALGLRRAAELIRVLIAQDSSAATSAGSEPGSDSPQD